jgi:anaerobic nitric oxide reductase transcription regulator
LGGPGQPGDYPRLGGLRGRKINVRIIAATNQQLEQQVRQGAFRADLYFRLWAYPA